MKTFFLMPSLDQVDLEKAMRVVAQIAPHPFVSSFKVGFSLGLTHGLPRVVEAIRKHTDKPIVYDHQKAGTDIPDTGGLFADVMKNAGINEAILFPQAGPETLKAWVPALTIRGVTPVVGGLMTHRGFLQSEGGFLSDDSVRAVYTIAAELGVRRFVVPLTKPKLVEGIDFPADAIFYSPGFGAQGGDPHAFPFLRTHHLIAGRALFAAADPLAWVTATAKELA
jgi:orotidine-5'-phosphate decarboxylase